MWSGAPPSAFPYFATTLAAGKVQWRGNTARHPSMRENFSRRSPSSKFNCRALLGKLCNSSVRPTPLSVSVVEFVSDHRPPFIYSDQKSLLSAEAQGNITQEVATALQASALAVYEPVTVTPLRTAVVAVQWQVFPYALIIIAALILLLGTVGIIYICVSWSRYRAYKERMQRMYVVPRYDPVFVEPNLKEYETQVLQMSVPLDDNDSYNDLQLDFSRKNHAFTLDNVSYITKDNGDSIGQQSPVSSDAATTTRASSLVGRHDNVNNNNIHQPGILNPVYDKSDDERGLNSSTNENVTFREKKDYTHLGFNYLIDRSPIETTTEL